MPQIITIDEWITYYLSDRSKLNATYEFLSKVEVICDSFICLKDSPLAEKIWNLSSASSNWIPAHRFVISYFFRVFVRNSRKFHFIDASDLAGVPPEIVHSTPPSDLYLVKTALSTSDKLILTTDVDLRDKLSEFKELHIAIASDFMKSY